MNKFLICLLIFVYSSCSTNSLVIKADLPKALNEVSGIETTASSNLIWMLNDGGNKSRIYAISKKGNIKERLKVDTKNNDWEDLTSDKKGNLYIGDFGNNFNKRKNLTILKIESSNLKKGKDLKTERISFYYPDQNKFPPKSKNMYFDCEAFFHFNDSLYLFTKSRVKGDYGRTNLYKIPATEGKHKAVFLTYFTTCKDMTCWATSADISDDGKTIALLTQKTVWWFSDFSGDDFFNGTVNSYTFENDTQKEGVCFKNNNTLYITDEKTNEEGGNLYELQLN